LALAAEEIARDRRLLEQLYTDVGALTRLAAPADVESIRLTQAFVRNDGGGSETPAYVRATARRLLRWTWASGLFGLLVFFAAITLLIHVDQGRRALQQLEQVRKEYQAVTDGFAVARTATAGTPGAAGQLECRDEPAEGPAVLGTQSQATPQQHALCGRLRDVLLQMSIVHRELSAWNTISERLSYASPVTWLAPRPVPVAGLSEEQWHSTELRTATMLASLTGFVLPMLLGLLGACVYVYRELDAHIEAGTLDAREGVHGTLRMLLGAILGGLLGTMWTNRQAIQLEGVSLTLGTLAFVVGFSVEVVFRLVDTLVRAAVSRVSKPAA
jgi:hypothetical protein